MPYVKLSDGTLCHVKMGKAQGPQCAATLENGQRCRKRSGYQCDYRLPSGAGCDVHLCADHARTMGPDRHYCPPHFQMDCQQQHRKLFTALGC